MQIDPNAERHEAALRGLTLTFPTVYYPGHPLTENEAKFVSGAVQYAVLNAHNNHINRGLKELDEERKMAFKGGTYSGPMDEKGKKPAPATVADLAWDHQAMVDERLANFEPGSRVRARRGGGPSVSKKDPVAILAKRIATDRVKELMTKQGRNIREAILTPSETHGNKLAEIVAAYMERHPEIHDLARAQHEATSTLRSEDEDLSALAA